MIIIFRQCDEATRTEIALGASYEDVFQAKNLIQFLARVCIVCNVSNNGGLLFGSHVAEITEYNFHPIRSVEELLVAHPTNDDV